MLTNRMEFNTMALVPCPECQKEVSTHALACPQCALPFPGKQACGLGQAGTKLHSCPDCGCPVSKQAQTCPHCGVTLEGEQREGEQRPLPTNQNFVEETWLCTHCGTPYTRKVRQEKELVTDHQSALAASIAGHRVERLLEPVLHQETVVPTSNAGRGVEKLLEPAPHQETVVPTSNGGRGVEKLLEPAPHQETVVPTSNGERSGERPLGPRPNQVKRKKVSASPRRQSQLWQDSSFGEEIESFLPRYPRSRKKSILLGLLVFILIAASVVGGALWQLQGINPLEILVYWRM